MKSSKIKEVRVIINIHTLYLISCIAKKYSKAH